MSWTTPADLKVQLQKLWDRGDILRYLVGRGSGKKVDLLLADTGQARVGKTVSGNNVDADLTAGDGNEQAESLAPKGAIFFPLQLRLNSPTSSEMTERTDEVMAWIAAVRGLKHMRIEWREFRHKVFGKNAMPDKVWVDSLDDALLVLNKRKDASRFQQIVDQTQHSQPQLMSWIEQFPLRALEYESCWTQLLQVVRWLAANPRPDIYLRQVDLPGIDSKFIENNKQVLSELFDLILPAEAVDATVSGVSRFSQRYGFKDKPIRVRFRILDPNHWFVPTLVPGSFEQDISLDCDCFANLRLNLSNVYITENEVNFLSFPPLPNSMVIFGGGYGLDAIKRASWLLHCRVFYWGDIDTHGFAILNSLRSQFPQTVSILMDESTLLCHKDAWGFEEKPASSVLLPHLTDAELSLFDALRNNKWRSNLRLEQERIAWNYAVAAIDATGDRESVNTPLTGTAPIPSGFEVGSAPIPSGFEVGSAPIPAGFEVGSAPIPAGFEVGSARIPAGFEVGSARIPAGFEVGSARIPAGFEVGSARIPAGFEVGTAPIPSGCSVSESLPQLSAADIHTYFCPSECERRVYLQHHSPIDVQTDPFVDLLKNLGARHEKLYVSNLSPITDLSMVPQSECFEKTKVAVQELHPVIYQPLLTAVTTLGGRVVSISGRPDLLVVENGRYVIRDVKLARRISPGNHPEMILQIQLYGWLFNQVFAQPALRLELVNGAGEVVPVQDDSGAAALQTLMRILLLREGALPYSPVGWSKCTGCAFQTDCWTEAEERRDVALVPNVDQNLVLALRRQGCDSIEKLIKQFDEQTLSAFQRQYGGKSQKVGKKAATILNVAHAIHNQRATIIAEPNLPTGDTVVFIDFEGLPPYLDQIEKIYIWGMLVCTAGGDGISGSAVRLNSAASSHYYHGLSPIGSNGDREGWEQFLANATSLFTMYGDVPFVHWHHYETVQISKYINRYGDSSGVGARVLTNCVDLLEIFRESVSMPIPSYSLKVVEKFLAVERTQEQFGGTWSMAKFIEATETDNDQERDKLIEQILTYNREDLYSTWAAFRWLQDRAAEQVLF